MVVCGLLSVFFLFHLNLVSRNVTTIEFCEKIRTNTGVENFHQNKPYNCGLRKNFRAVFGDDATFWFLPTSKSSRANVSRAQSRGRGHQLPIARKPGRKMNINRAKANLSIEAVLIDLDQEITRCSTKWAHCF